MKFQVLKNFSQFVKGQIVDLPPSRRLQTLINTRFLLPVDEVMEEVMAPTTAEELRTPPRSRRNVPVKKVEE